MQVYDFYKDPPQTSKDVKDYLVSWLGKVIIDEAVAPIVDHSGAVWHLTHEFRRAFHLHQVYSDEEKWRFAFHVDEYGWDGKSAPNMGVYDSWSEMIDGVAAKYAVAWKLAS